MAVTAETRQVYDQAVARLRSQRPELAWLDKLRQKALAEFSATGFPTTAGEDWRYTDLRPVAERSRELAGDRGSPPAHRPVTADDEPLRMPGLTPGVVITGGVPDARGLRARAVPGLAIATLASARGEDRQHWLSRLSASDDDDEARGLAALNTALLGDALTIDVAPGSRLAEPIYLLFEARPGRAAYNRVMLRIGAGSSCTLIEHFRGHGATLSHSVIDIGCESGSRLTYLKLQDESDEAFHLATQRLSMAREASTDLLHLDLGGRLARNDLNVSLNESGAAVTARGLFFADGSRHLDNHTRVDHRAPQTTSREVYRGIADGTGRGVFNGKIVVHHGADQTDARLTNQNLLLSSGAEIDTKPELEIYADDVRCAHGATTGQLDPAAVFYLRSRGVPEAQARRILIAAFAREIVQYAGDAALQAHVTRILGSRLPELAEVATGP